MHAYVRACVPACVHVCAYACEGMAVRAWTSRKHRAVCVSVCLCVCVSVCLCVCVSVKVDANAKVNVRERVYKEGQRDSRLAERQRHVCMCVYTYMCVRARMCVRECVCVMYAHTHRRRLGRVRQESLLIVHDLGVQARRKYYSVINVCV